MLFKNTDTHFGVISKTFHWLIALLVLIQFGLIALRDWVFSADSPRKGFLIGGLHKPIGVITLLVIVLAILWKLRNTHPRFPLRMNRLEKTLAHTVHALLYLGVLLMAVSGLVMSTAAGYPINFFGHYTLPLFLEKNDTIASFFHSMHEILVIPFLVLIALHIVAALKHHFIDKSIILKRMLPFS